MLSFIADRSLAAKIVTSFVAILAITVAVGAAGIAFTRVLQDRMGRTADLAQTMTSLQAIVADVRAYAAGGDPAAARAIEGGLAGLEARLAAERTAATAEEAARFDAAATAVGAMRDHLARAVAFHADRVAAAQRIEAALTGLSARGVALEDVATKTAKDAGNAESATRQAVKDAARLIGSMREIRAAVDAAARRFAAPAGAGDADAIAGLDVAKALRKANGTVPKDAPASLDQIRDAVAAVRAAAEGAVRTGSGREAVAAAAADAFRPIDVLADLAGRRVTEASAAFTDLAARAVVTAGISSGSVKYVAQSRKLALDVARLMGDIRKETVDSVAAQIEALQRVVEVLATDGASVPEVASVQADVLPVLDGLRDDTRALREAEGWFVAHLADVRVRLADAMTAMDALVAGEREAAAGDQAMASVGILAALAAAVALAALVGLVLVLVIRRPIRALTAAMQKLAAGDVDAALQGVERRDEIGEMTRAVLVFRDNALERSRLEADAAAERQAREARNAKVVAMIRDFEARAGSLLQAVSSSGGTLRKTADSLGTVAASTAGRARSASGATGEASSNVQTVAAAAEELASSIDEISRQVTHTKSVVDEAVASARETNASMAGLSEMAGRIGAVVALIKAVANQTNLLALNATIEAARAGEAGKGFAVVAQEVKGLAKQTADATEEISRQIAAIQQATAASVGAIAGIAATIDDVGSHTTGIAAAVEQQGAATAEISANIQRVASGARVVVDDMGRLTEQAAETSAMSGAVLRATEEMSDAAANLQVAIRSFLADVAA